MKDAIEILKQWLSEHGWDGLASPDLECGCGLDDFMPCGNEPRGCYPAVGNWEYGFYTVADTDAPPVSPSANGDGDNG